MEIARQFHPLRGVRFLRYSGICNLWFTVLYKNRFPVSQSYGVTSIISIHTRFSGLEANLT